MKGHKGLSVDSGTAIAQRLGLDLTETRFFCDLITAQHARTAAARTMAATRVQGASAMKDYTVLKDDEFSFIGYWYHLAILELIGHTTHLSVEEIANKLQLKTILVEEAMDRLHRLKLVETGADGTVTKIVAGVTTTSNIPSEAIRSHHQQLIEKSIEALSTQDVQERDFTSITVAFDRSRVGEAKALIERFKNEFLVLTEASGKAKPDVYALGIQLFNLTHASLRASPSKNFKSERSATTLQEPFT
jgi:uncharacterized protein (TIGR02147 family)